MEDEEIRIGGATLQSYITACIVGISKQNKVVLLARGRNIKTAIDVAEIFKRKLKNIKSHVEIGSVEYKEVFVSTIRIEIEGELL